MTTTASVPYEKSDMGKTYVVTSQCHDDKISFDEGNVAWVKWRRGYTLFNTKLLVALISVVVCGCMTAFGRGTKIDGLVCAPAIYWVESPAGVNPAQYPSFLNDGKVDSYVEPNVNNSFVMADCGSPRAVRHSTDLTRMCFAVILPKQHSSTSFQTLVLKMK